MIFLGIWLFIVLIVSVLPVSGPETDLPLDKIVHLVMYGITSIFVFRIIETKITRKRAFLLSVAIATLYGASMEVVQYFLPQRSFSFGDMAANALGAFLGSLVYIKGKGR